ncbi:MAG TPA: AraC family transcriptional regulator [Burkholderiales bacterium]|nr:AraC family transcriptional regulator [Burkholderiales bacterium]
MPRDTLSDLLSTLRLRGAVFYYVSFREQWAAEAGPTREIIEAVMPGAEHIMEYHMVAKGCGWAAISGLPPVRLSAGDIVMFPHGDAHVMSSAPDMRPERYDADWVFATRHVPKPIPISYHHGVMHPGSLIPVAEAETVLVCGFLGCDLRPFNPLIAALPRLLHVSAERAGSWIGRVIDQAAAESAEPRPGGQAVLERLSEMMFVDTARRYLDSLPEDATGWLAGLRDRYVGRALGLLHERPEHPWTIDELGREVGLSRSALHERFMRYLGQPPIQYLANWRIQLGSRLLRETRRTVAAIALEVGYESEAAFSRAFKRLVGAPPAAWRRAQAVG